MKVKTLSVKNLRNVGRQLEVNFEFDDTIVKISGENGAGKSTVVDAIFLAIVGKTLIGKGRSIESLITKGEPSAEIEVVLEGSGKQIKIKRKITKAGNVGLDVWASDASKLTQKDLDDLLSEFTIDPLAFTSKSKKEQYESIKQLVGLDTQQIDAQIEQQETKTQEARAVKTEYKKTLDNVGKPDKVEPVNTEKLSAQLEEVIKHNDKVKALQSTIHTNSSRSMDIDKQIAELQARKQELLEEAKVAQEQLMEIGNAEKSTTEITVQLQQAEETNKKANEWARYVEILTKSQNYEADLNREESKLEDLRGQRKEMIAKAKMPIDGMEFTEKDGVIIDGIPLDQFSSAEQIFIASKIATSVNPQLKVIYIKDGSLLDKNTLQKLSEIAVKEDYQVFIERVGEEFDSIVMRDGLVVEDSIE